MKLILSHLFLIFTLLFSISIQAQETEEFDLDPIINIINKSLEVTAVESKGVKLNSAKINLKTSLSKNAGGGFKVIFKAKTKFAWERSSEVTYTYSIPDKTGGLGIESNQIPKGIRSANKKLEPSLIVILSKALKSIEASTGSIPELSKRSMQVKVSFTAKKRGEAGVEFSLFDLIGVDSSVDAEKTAVHTITLDFDII